MKTYVITIAACVLTFFQVQGQQIWTEVYEHPTSTNLMAIDFPTDQIGYVLGGAYLDIGVPANGFVLKTTNGGIDWNIVADSTQYQFSLYNKTIILFKNSQTGTIISSGSGEANIDNAIYKTTDGGNSWTHTSIVGLRKINDMQLVNGILYLYGKGEDAQGNFEGRLYTSNDMGSNWSLIYRGEGFSQIYFLDNQTGFAQHPPGLIYKTTNGGNSWQQISNIQNPNGITEVMTTLFFINDQIGFSGGWYSPMSMKTTDGGYTWGSAIEDEASLILGNVSAHKSSGTIYTHTSTGSSASLYRSMDNSETWTEIVPNHEVDILHLFNEFKGVGISIEGKIYLMDTSSLSVEDTKPEKIKIYPNPAENTLNIEIAGQISIQKICLTDLNGKTVWEYLGNVRQIDISNLVAGNYFLQVYSNQGKITKKIIVE